MMKRHGQDAIYYAHAGAGELHLRPVLNLKQKKAFISLEILLVRSRQSLVKKIPRFISGEHGDGIVRGEFYLYDW
jgi:FAD/FMN-containing dehydrogenase